MFWKPALLCCVALSLSACNTWSTSNVSNERPEAAAVPIAPESVTVVAGDLPGQDYEVISELRVSVNKTTAFHPSPTEEMVRAKLKEEAASIGANAVINAKITGVQISALSWGQRVGTGTAVRTK